MAKSASGHRLYSLCLALKKISQLDQVPGQSKEEVLALLDMNKNVLVTPKEVCLFAVHRIQQDGIDGLEPGTFERCPFTNGVLRSIDDAVIRGTCRWGCGQYHEDY